MSRTRAMATSIIWVALLIELVLPTLSIDPECSWDSCPVCLADAKAEGANVVLSGPDGKMYSTPFRLARASEHWYSQSIVQTTMGILFREKLGINVEYVDSVDEYHTVLAMLNCAGYNDYVCDQQPQTLKDAERLVAEGKKAFSDPLPDIFASVEVWPGALNREELGVTEEQMDQGHVIGYGSSGFLIKQSLWVLPQAARHAWSMDRIVLRSYLPWTTGAVNKFLTTPQEYKDGGVVAEFPGCPGDAGLSQQLIDGFAMMESLGYVCRDSWWLTPACVALDTWLDDCVGVLDDDWGFPKPVMYTAMKELDMRVAKLTAGYDGMYEAVMSRRFNSSFLWWDTDTQFVSLQPRGVQLEQDLDTESLIVQKQAWSKAAKASTKIDTILKGFSLSNGNLNSMLKLIADAVDAGYTASENVQPGFYQKLACDWVRGHEDVWSAWLPSPTSCNSGEKFDVASQGCKPCLVGSYFVSNASGLYCELCEPGTVQPLTGQLQCTACPAGSIAATSGAKECDLCTLGSYSDAVGKSECMSCSANRAHPDLWTSFRQVQLDTGAEAWFPTDGASNESACGCSEGAWMGPGGSNCQPCVTGMACPGSFGFEVAPGYYSKKDAPTEFFLCMDGDSCPGGAPETCAGERVGLVCEECPLGEQEGDRRYSCVPCKGKDDQALIILAVAAAWIVLAAVLGTVFNLQAQQLQNNMSPISGFVVLLGSHVGMFQIVGIVSSSPVEWSTEFKPFLNFSKLFTLEMGFLSLRCGVGSSDLGHFAMRSALFLYIFSAIWFCHCVTLLSPFKLLRWNWRVTVNFTGQMFLAAFTTMVALSVFPLSCYSHPNGQRSIRSYPATICWEKEHLAMVIVGTVFFAVTFAFAALLCFAVWRAPTLSANTLRTLIFLVGNYRAEMFYFGIIRVARSVLIAMVAVIFPSDGVAQLFAYTFLMLVVCVLQAILWPWKHPVLNWADVVMNAGMVLFLFLSAVSLQSSSPITGPLMTAVMALTVSATAACGVYLIALICKLVSRKKDDTKLRELVGAWAKVSGNLMVLSGSPDALVALFAEISVYDLHTLQTALRIFESCGLSASMGRSNSKSLRMTPSASDVVLTLERPSNTPALFYV